MDKIFAITIEAAAGVNTWDLFDEVQKLKDFCSVVKLNANGTVVDAGIYETADQLTDSIAAVNHGDKKEIVANLPASGDSLQIGAAVELMDIQMKNKGFEGFSEEEIQSIENVYSKEQSGMVR